MRDQETAGITGITGYIIFNDHCLILNLISFDQKCTLTMLDYLANYIKFQN
jgi:hypothetical protein